MLNENKGAGMQKKIRVHDARIATFGERAEDIFVISDRDNHALSDPAVLHGLQAALLDYLEGRKP